MLSSFRIPHFVGNISIGLFGIFVGLWQNAIAASFPHVFMYGGIIFFGLITAAYMFSRQRQIEPYITAMALRDDSARKRDAHDGLIVFLSVYQNFKRKPGFSPEELRTAVESRDYRTLMLADTDATNFGHAIKAIQAHLSALKHCWIITTKSAREQGITSASYLEVFLEFLRTEVIPAGKDLRFHVGDNYTVDMTEDSAVCTRTNQIVTDIYAKAKRSFGLSARDIIADVTGGVTAMKVGTVLACLAKDQDVQVIGSLYDEVTGKPKGGVDSFPILIRYAPRLELKD